MLNAPLSSGGRGGKLGKKPGGFRGGGHVSNMDFSQMGVPGTVAMPPPPPPPPDSFKQGGVVGLSSAGGAMEYLYNPHQQPLQPHPHIPGLMSPGLMSSLDRRHTAGPLPPHLQHHLGMNHQEQPPIYLDSSQNLSGYDGLMGGLEGAELSVAGPIGDCINRRGRHIMEPYNRHHLNQHDLLMQDELSLQYGGVEGFLNDGSANLFPVVAASADGRFDHLLLDQRDKQLLLHSASSAGTSLMSNYNNPDYDAGAVYMGIKRPYSSMAFYNSNQTSAGGPATIDLIDDPLSNTVLGGNSAGSCLEHQDVLLYEKQGGHIGGINKII